MRAFSSFLIVLLLIPSFSAASVPEEGSDLMGDILITAVMPVHSSEFVIITNVGDSVHDLSGLTVTDGEGFLTIPMGTTLSPGGELVIASGEQTFLDMEGRQLILITDMERRGSFILADRGDWVHVIDGDVVLDTFVYGDVDRLLPGWDGPPFPKIGRCSMAVRTPGVDTDTWHDWYVSVPGRSDFPRTEHLAEVYGFTFPEDGFTTIMRELLSAKHSISVSLYYLDNMSVMALLADMARSGVSVEVLIEGAPVGGINERTASRLMAMAEAGCDIRLLRSADGYKRYDYMHAKYAVIDDVKVMVTSENWRTSAFESNRGWGAVTYSTSLAALMMELFRSDRDADRHDSHCLRTYYSYLQPQTLIPFVPVFDQAVSTQMAMVSPVIGPDHGNVWLQTLMDGAEERAYSQQFYVQPAWVHGESPLRWMRDAGARGVDSRLLLDSTFMGDSQGRNTMVAASFEVWDGCQGRLWDGGRPYTLQHNKGMVIDDTVVVSTYNWVDASFERNREVAFLIRSMELAEGFAAIFREDWSIDPYPPVAVLDWEERSYRAGETVLLMANRSHDNVGIESYLWDLDGDGVFDREGSHLLHVAREGVWNCTLRVVDAEGNHDDLTFVMEVEATEEGIGLSYLPLAGVFLLLAMLRARTMLRSLREEVTP